MSRQAGSIVSGNSKPRRISVKAGRQQVAAMYCGHGQRSRYEGTEGRPEPKISRQRGAPRQAMGSEGPKVPVQAVITASRAENPIIWLALISAYPWGQTDSLPACYQMASLRSKARS